MKKLAFIKRSNGRHWVGDGFPVQNIFSYRDIHEEMSPFLLMDYAGPAHFDPTDKRRGVGQHPHRGFETVTIVYAGQVSHHDSTDAGGTIGPGDVQWMTAGSGIVHEEYHGDDYARTGGAFEMIQLWVNLPAKDKMTKPGYQGISSAQVPEVDLPAQAGKVRVIAGEFDGRTGPASTFSPMNVWDVRLNAGATTKFILPEGYTTAIFVLNGAVGIGDVHTIRPTELAVMQREGSELVLEARQDTVLLLLNGAPLNEPVVGHGPFVMNSWEEIDQAIADYNNGRFVTT
ncbi:pirin family protein [Methylobacillus flagellatus]|uniref:Pirin-like protein n=1 Tax=Methylobacillus flagellatus (strain ATCC 51484 / DSM 6875 / VKM B-1610 / KT) TaxID=265072 RepID=Q1GY48_METFK|nr:pirin family protein [Methylobacillus flagellatus]ABE50839.1 Pirin-like protein [Methylobacillus flagellatus KT]